MAYWKRQRAPALDLGAWTAQVGLVLFNVGVSWRLFLFVAASECAGALDACG
jgi:hypothetical protein